MGHDIHARIARSAPLTVLTICCLVPEALAGTRNVPVDYPTIQAAIVASVTGDEIVLADGTYMGASNADVDFLGKDVTVRSASGNPAACVIDCQYTMRGFVFEGGETSAARLEGITIRAGFDSKTGGGVFISASSPTIVSCVFDDCRAGVHNSTVSVYGGGMAIVDAASPKIEGCTFRANIALANFGAMAFGGAIANRGQSTPTIVDCVFEENLVFSGTGDGWFHGGGGIASEESMPRVIGCTFVGNHADSAGGAVFGNMGSETSLSRSSFGGNSSIQGGAIYNGTNGFIGGPLGSLPSDTRIASCQFTNNTADLGGGGGAIHHASGDLEVHNGLFAGNVTVGSGFPDCFVCRGGGAIYAAGDTVTLVNCTVAQNTAGVAGGGVAVDGAVTTMANCIVWGNAPDALAGSPATVSSSDVEGGYAGTGNIDLDPAFANSGAGDYRLAAGSLAIDAGDDAALPADTLDVDDDGDVLETLPVDLDGAARVTGMAVDMGAYEFTGGGAGADFDGDGTVGFADLTTLLAAWGTCSRTCPTDLDGDGGTGFADLTTLLAAWGTGG